MSDSNSVTAAMTMIVGAMGLALRPDELGVGLALGVMGSYLVRAMTPSDNRAEAWLIPIAAAFVCVLAVQIQPHLPIVATWHPSLIMALAGAFSVPVLRAMQAVGAVLPQIAKRAAKARLEGDRDE